MLKSIKDDTEFQQEYFKLLEKYKHKHEVEYYEEIYKEVVDSIDDIRNAEGELKSALDCIAYMTRYPDNNTLFLDPDNLKVNYVRLTVRVLNLLLLLLNFLSTLVNISLLMYTLKGSLCDIIIYPFTHLNWWVFYSR